MPQSNYQAFRELSFHPTSRAISRAWQQMILSASTRENVRDALLRDDLWLALYFAAIELTSVPKLRRAIIACVKRYRVILNVAHIDTSDAIEIVSANEYGSALETIKRDLIR